MDVNSFKNFTILYLIPHYTLKPKSLSESLFIALPNPSHMIHVINEASPTRCSRLTL